jgi:hypothetical protein
LKKRGGLEKLNRPKPSTGRDTGAVLTTSFIVYRYSPHHRFRVPGGSIGFRVPGKLNRPKPSTGRDTGAELTTSFVVYRYDKVRGTT